MYDSKNIIGYFYDNEGFYTYLATLEAKEVKEKIIEYMQEGKLFITEEKLCALHQSIQNGTYKPEEGAPEPIYKEHCPDCVMRKEEWKTVLVPYEYEVLKGYEPVIPKNCTLDSPGSLYKPKFVDGAWIQTENPPPPPPPQKSPIEIVQEQLAVMMEGLDSIFAGEGSAGKYLALRIKDGKLDYTSVIDKRPDLKAEIDFILNSKTEI